MSTFMNDLRKAEANGISPWKLMVAAEVKNQFEDSDQGFTDEDLEAICEYVYDWVMDTEATPAEVVEALDTLLWVDVNDPDYEPEITIDQIKNWDPIVRDKVNNCF